MNQFPKQRLHFQLKLLLGGIFIVLLIYIAKYTDAWNLLQTVLQWVANLGDFQPIAFILVYNLATVLFMPGVLLTMSAGVMFGVVWGSIYVAIAATLGATWAFLIGRYLCRDLFRQMIQDHPKFLALDHAVAADGFKIVLLTRLSPILPFNLLNYAFGITEVSLKDYVLGSLGILPGTVMYVYLGSLVGDLAMLGKTNMPSSPEVQHLQWILRGIGLLMTITMTFYLARLAKKALNTTI